VTEVEAVPGWLRLAVVGGNIVLALATVGLMLLQRPAGADESARRGQLVDPMLLVTAMLVILLALAAWLLG
jgi:hypothetical protein